MFLFPFLLPSYCHSVAHRFVSIVFDSYNQSSVLFYVVIESLYRSVNTVFNAGKSSSTLLSWYNTWYSLSTSSLGCYALCKVISFLVLWSICWFSLVHVKNGPEYQRFLLDNFVSNSFLVLLSYSFLIFSFISTGLMVSTSKMPRYM